MNVIKLIHTLIKICRILSGRDIFIVIILIFFSTLAEAFSIGVIVPIFTNHQAILEVMAKFGIEANLGYLVMIVVIVFMVKSWFVWLVMDKQNSYSYRIQYLASKRIFSNLKDEDYQVITRKGKDYYSSLFNVDLVHFRDTLLLVILLLSESAVVVGLLIVAAYFAPLYTAICALLLIGALLIFRATFAHISSLYGYRRARADIKKNSWIRGYLGSLEESRVMDTSSFFLKGFDIAALESSFVGAKQNTVNQSPRFIFESLVVVMIGVVVVISMMENSVNPQNELKVTLLPLIALAAVAFRILPSLNRISGALQGINFGSSAVETVSNELDCGNKITSKYKSLESQISEIKSFEVRDISLCFDKVSILSGGSALFRAGGINALVGESGVGKSSLIKSILGLYKIDRGLILINDRESNLHKYIKAGRVALVPQHSFIVDGTVLDNILVGRNYSQDLIEKLNKLLDWVNFLPNGINTRIGESGLQVSGGQAQRLNIARALYNEPEFVIMDESTSALDTETQETIINYLIEYSLNHLVIMITHREEVLKKCISVHKIQAGLIQKCE